MASDSPSAAATTAAAVLVELTAELASGAAAADAIEGLLRRLGEGTGVDQVVFRSESPLVSSLRWHRDPAVEHAPVGASLEQPVRGDRDRLGLLVVRCMEGRLPELPTADMEQVLQAAAHLCAGLLRRESALAALRGALTERVRDLSTQRVFMERILDSLPLSLYVIDRQYQVQAWNQAREQALHGVSRRDALGRSIFDVLARQPADRLREEFDEVFASGRMIQFEMASEAFGASRLFRISKVPMRLNAPEVTHVITVGEDITAWREALDRTARAEKLAALGQLAAGVMHEINNPLATIAACAETLALTRPAPPAGAAGPDMLQIIDLEVQRCRKIATGLLDFARGQPAPHVPFDLNGMVERTAFLMQHHPRVKRIRLLLELGPSMFVTGDADQLIQVVMALALNAVDATPERGTVVLRTCPEAEGRLACIEVEDEGPGIPEALRARIFEPFFTTKPVGQGTGLGLAIAYGIAADHGGEITLRQEPDRGAVFRVTLPRHEPEVT